MQQYQGQLLGLHQKVQVKFNNEEIEEEKDENHGKIDIDEVSDNSSISLDLDMD